MQTQKVTYTIYTRIAEGLIPTLPPEKFLTTAPSGRRRIVTTKFRDYESINIIEQQVVNNSLGFQIPNSRKAQYSNSFFVRSVAEWNQLSDTDLPHKPARPTSAASTAPDISGLSPPNNIELYTTTTDKSCAYN